MAEAFRYSAPSPEEKGIKLDDESYSFPPLDGPKAVNLGTYKREIVSNVDGFRDGRNFGRQYFDMGLRRMFGYQHEEAAKCFLACVRFSPYCALAHAFVALCHSPNYNFKGEAYYDSTHHLEEANMDPEFDHLATFPSQQIADRHSALATQIVETLRKMHRSKKNGKKKGKGKKAPPKESHTSDETQERSIENDAEKPDRISETEAQLISAIRIRTCNPGVDPSLAELTVGRPYADAMKKVYMKYPNDAEVVYCYAESLMVLHAWQLYEYPTGKPLSEDVPIVREVLETALKQHLGHAGICHLYVHLSEMSANPGQALGACKYLRSDFPECGHLIHMATHVDVLVGDYESCVRYNYLAIEADEKAVRDVPETAGVVSFYFGYIAHNYHMLVYGAILGGMEQIALDMAEQLNKHLTEQTFVDHPGLIDYLETYASLDIHILIRFGRWQQILELESPKDSHLMMYRAATLCYARGLAHANLGDTDAAKVEAARFDQFRKEPDAKVRILHNNTVSELMEVDAPMLRGEIAYHEGRYDKAFSLLRTAVRRQDELKYDEPWGKMQPIRHALGGLLLEQGHLKEAEEVFRKDLKFHPKNPWGMTGLAECLRRKENGSCCAATTEKENKEMNGHGSHLGEIRQLEEDTAEQRKSKWADFEVKCSCACCKELTN